MAPRADGPPPRIPVSPTMLNSLLTRVFGSRNERLLGQLAGIVKKINSLEP